MPKYKKRIFSKNNSVTFKLVHRGQKDPLINDDTAPQMVLQPLEKNDKRSRINEQMKYGVYFEDDYDYLQHLKSCDELPDDAEMIVMSTRDQHEKKKDRSKIMLPSSLFPSTEENEEGMLAGAVLPLGPQPDWDPDIVAALCDDVDFDDPENQLEDDFVMKANAPIEGKDDNREDGSDEDTITGDDESDVSSEGLMNENEDDFGDLPKSSNRKRYDTEETKSCFTDYSMTSSVMRRNEGLSLLDAQFESMFEKEYGEETELGALDLDDIEGPIDADQNAFLQKLLETHMTNRQIKSQVRKELNVIRKEAKSLLKDKDLYENLDEEQEDKVVVELENLGKHGDDRLDCESIISTYSNLYNHPKLIYDPKEPKNSRRVKVDPRTGIPVDKPGLTAANLKKLNHGNLLSSDSRDEDEQTMMTGTKSVTSLLSKMSVRTKDETPEEKKVRKSVVKELRRERRQEKKANRLAFKQEEKRLHQEAVNVHQNLSTVRLV